MNRKTVLLIDDDPAILHMYTLKFSLQTEYRFATANSPASGVRLAQRTVPDLILLDLVLPKSDGLPQLLDKRVGFQVLRELKADPRTNRIPVVILTNLDEASGEAVKKAKALGAIDYWIKANHPPSEIVERVKRLLLSNQMRRCLRTSGRAT